MRTLLDWFRLPADFMPHGHCYLWRPDVLWLHVVSDALIAGSYYAIPIALAYFVRRRRAVLPYWWVPALFAAFIFLCGTTHLMNIWTVWNPDYRLDGLIKLATGLVSASTTWVVFGALPQALALRTPIELQSEVDQRTSELIAANDRLLTEIEAHKRTEAALRASEARFRATFENAAVGIAHVSSDGRWLQVNAVLCALTGYSREELLALTFGDITHPADIEKDLKLAASLLDGEIDDYELEKRYIRKDGGIVWALLTVSLVRDTDGKPSYFISVVDDITDRKRTEEALQENELRVRLALEASRAATWHIDYTREATEHFDARGRELAGLDPLQTQWRAGTFCELLHPEDRARMQIAAQETHAVSGPGPAMEYRILRPNGETVWLQGAGIVQRSVDGQPLRFIGVSIDITDRRRLEMELRRTIQRLAEADRRKDEFLATLAHELRNPLAPIANGVQILKRIASPDPLHQRTAEMMERQTRHLVRLVDDLLDVSRITRGKVVLRVETVTLQAVLQGALESSWTARESARLELEVDLPSEPVRVEGDRDRLTQVFSNIISNAAKYTPDGGRVRLSVRQEGDEAIVSVKDTGVGIPADALELVFEMFSQLRGSNTGDGGLGIGLALVRQLVRLHGGSVEARSEGPGHGSEFIVRLPAKSPATAQGLSGGPAADASGDPAGAAIAGERRRILVVDDNLDSAESLKALLELGGHEVEQASDGFQALEAVRTFRPAIVFMDIGMPNLDGLEATRRIRDLPLPAQPIIVALTGWGQDADRERSRRYGVDLHLIKPIDPEAVRRVLRLVM
jgi:PAS domain S-box-containing protein